MWKRGGWIPAFKGDDPLLKENYRPITFLPVIDKVFEQIITKQLVGMFDHHLEHNLTAYRKTYSCETILINIKINLRFVSRIRKIPREVIMDTIGFPN